MYKKSTNQAKEGRGEEAWGLEQFEFRPIINQGYNSDLPSVLCPSKESDKPWPTGPSAQAYRQLERDYKIASSLN